MEQNHNTTQSRADELKDMIKIIDNAWAGFPENEMARHYYYDRRNESAFILKSKIESLEWLASPEGQEVMNSLKK